MAERETPEQFSKAVRRLPSQDQIERKYSDLLFALSSVAKRKYHYVKLAIYTGFTGGLIAGFVLFLERGLR